MIMWWMFVYAMVGKLSYLLMVKYDYPSNSDSKEIIAVLWVFAMPIVLGLIFPSICTDIHNYLSTRMLKGKK